MSDDSDIEIVFVGEESPVSPVYGRQSGRLENYEQVTAIEIEVKHWCRLLLTFPAVLLLTYN